MPATATRISTNVRFCALIVGALAAGGCASPGGSAARAPLVGSSGARSCEAATLLVCESFGPERRCECARRTDLDLDLVRAASTGTAWRGALTR